MIKKLNLATLSKNELTKKEMQVNGGLAICRCYCYCECLDIASYTDKSREYRVDSKSMYLDWVVW